VRLAREIGAETLELNLERSQGSAWFDETRLGPATEVVPAWVDEMLKMERITKGPSPLHPISFGWPCA
jgi:NAD-dependent SIR2 family protein deacetylase